MEETALANERTLLSWVRTAFSIAAVGVLVARLPDDGTATSRWLAALACLAAMLMAALGMRRYTELQKMLPDALDRSSYAIFWLTLVFLALLLVWVVRGRPLP